MRNVKETMFFKVAWVVVGIVLVYDIAFAVTYGETFLSWEANPVQRLIFGMWGVAGVVVVRLAGVVTLFPMLLIVDSSTVRNHMGWAATSLVFAAHLILGSFYIILAMNGAGLWSGQL